MDFLEVDYDYRYGTPIKMEVTDWKEYLKKHKSEDRVRVSGEYSILLLKNSAIPLELMYQGYGIETSMCESHTYLSILVHAFTGLTWFDLHERLGVQENNVLSVFNLKTLNLVMQGAFELLTNMREENLTFKELDARARSIGVALRDQIGYNPFTSPSIYHKAYRTEK
tara:strand:+ start:1079 stop:1582 length:504 start_codon:yes stop_codon:yes gene_type:complete